MSEPSAARIPGQLDVDELLGLVLRDDATPAPAETVRGELVAPAAELLERFADTLIARPQTQRTLPPRVRALRPLARTAARPRGPDRGQASRATNAHLVAGGRSSATVK